MAFLATVKKHFVILGIMPIIIPLKVRKYQSLINRIHVIFMFIFLVSFANAVQYFAIFEAKTFSDYSKAIFFNSVTSLHLALYAILQWKRTDLLDLIHDLDRASEKSESILKRFRSYD